MNRKQLILSLAPYRDLNEIQSAVNMLFAEEGGFETFNIKKIKAAPRDKRL